MHRLRDHALSVSKELKTWVAVISLTLLASAAWADPQSEISVYRKSYGLSAVTEDAKLTELARQQANAMRGVRWITMCMHPLALAQSRTAQHRLPKTSRWGPRLSMRRSRYGNPRLVIMRIC